MIFTVAYPLAFDSVDQFSRPYIGSSQTNALMKLAFGYNGTDPTMSLSEFKKLGKSGQLKYFVMGNNSKTLSGQISKILTWVKKNGTKGTYSSSTSKYPLKKMLRFAIDGINLVVISIVGIYFVKIFTKVKHRPLFQIETETGLFVEKLRKVDDYTMK
ncbi:hypothetical protein ACOWPE_08045 [Leuconostoc suionicum]|uniref:hypothetical protein n=1 Tax=Leuconostoc suionicum TaxID=1511761 RepID=UPI003C567445